MTVLRRRGAIGLDRLKDVRMVADDDGRSGIQHLVCSVDVFGRGWAHIRSPMDRDDEKVALRAGALMAARTWLRLRLELLRLAWIGKKLTWAGRVVRVAVALSQRVMPSQPTLMPFASVKTGWKVVAAVSPVPQRAGSIAQMLRVSVKPGTWSMTWLLAKERF